jgi:hypothetical protein
MKEIDAERRGAIRSRGLQVNAMIAQKNLCLDSQPWPGLPSAKRCRRAAESGNAPNDQQLLNDRKLRMLSRNHEETEGMASSRHAQSEISHSRRCRALQEHSAASDRPVLVDSREIVEKKGAI